MRVVSSRSGHSIAQEARTALQQIQRSEMKCRDVAGRKNNPGVAGSGRAPRSGLDFDRDTPGGRPVMIVRYGTPVTELRLA